MSASIFHNSCLVWVKFNTRDGHITRLSNYEFCKNQVIEINTVLDNVYKMLTASSTFLSYLENIKNMNTKICGKIVGFVKIGQEHDKGLLWLGAQVNFCLHVFNVVHFRFYLYTPHFLSNDS
jgi:hypothetical protein